MTDYARADRIMAKLAAARSKFAGAFHPDAYSLIRRVETQDAEGGTTVVDSTVESGRCRLTVSQQMGGERTSGGIAVMSESRLTAELPIESLVTESDTLQINGRTFSISDVNRGGGFGLFTVVDLEELG